MHAPRRLANAEFHAELVRGLNPLQQKFHRHRLAEMTQGLSLWHSDRLTELGKRERQVPRHARQKWREEVYGDRRDLSRRTQRDVLDFLAVEIDSHLRTLDILRGELHEFREVIAVTPSEAEQKRVILEYSQRLGATPRQLREDRQALQRWMGVDTIIDRYQQQIGEKEFYVAFAFSRLGSTAHASLRAAAESQSASKALKRMDMERRVQTAMDYAGDPRIPTAALQSLALVLSALNGQEMMQALTAQTLADVYRIAADRSRDVWLQAAAMELLAQANRQRFDTLARTRLAATSVDDDLFVRSRILQMLPHGASTSAQVFELLQLALDDPSPFVRQQVVRTAWQTFTPAAIPILRELVLQDSSPAVRAAVLVESLEYTPRHESRRVFFELLCEVLAGDPDLFVKRTALHVTASWSAYFAGSTDKQPDANEATATSRRGLVEQQQDRACFYQLLVPVVRTLQQAAEPLSLRRWAADVGESLWCDQDAKARQLARELRNLAGELPVGESRFVPAKTLAQGDDDLVGRVLAVLAQNDFGFQLSRCGNGCEIQRGPTFGFRWWRWLLEMRRGATDKRQAFRHTVGRKPFGELRVPSGLLAEMSPTKVPGEPLYINSDANWRPFLPLLDDFLSTLGQGLFRSPPTRFFTSAGVTSVRAPKSLARRGWAYLSITRQFSQLAELRNWEPQESGRPHDYLRAMQRLGFEVHFQPHASPDTAAVSDPSISQFFPAVVALGTLPILGQLGQYASRYADYFASAFENTLTHLGIFAFGFSAFLVLKHIWSNHRIRNARRQLPLVIGGWGTRGKSGTERLKAALLAAAGASVFSKSTGCEAMFLHCPAFGKLREIPLFRPYDKATIWEQAHVLDMASRLHADVFLWECMGLTPDYVNILQRHWTRDDLSTITNAYPDHEDIQGPAGHDVAKVISGFAPQNARVLTTEQQMKPIIAESCRHAGSSLRPIHWLASGLITDDVLARFPYREHPDNIALVLAVADELEIPRDFAVKAMADEMVPDLGVLKTYPLTNVNYRTLEFTNGMSANERFGCLGNWRRLAYDQHDPEQSPGIWLSTVVNNRADRVARSRVFAQMLVEDLFADRHFLIGTNLKGLQGFIWEAWAEKSREYTLWPPDSAVNSESALRSLRAAARRFRQPGDEAAVERALRPLVERLLDCSTPANSPTIDVDAIVARWRDPHSLSAALCDQGVPVQIASAAQHFADQLGGNLQQLQELAEQVARHKEGRSTQLDDAFRELLRGWFEQKIVVIENSAATGEQIIARISEATPPGYLNRIMGIQNIKGTGLDFVYNWQTWDEIHSASQLLRNPDPATAKQGLQSLAGIPQLGLLAFDHLRRSVAIAKQNLASSRESLQAEIDNLAERIERSTAAIDEQLHSGDEQRPRWIDMLWRWAESLMDVQDAIRRRTKANQIYQDLENCRISLARATIEIRKLNKRQKGGWLTAERDF